VVDFVLEGNTEEPEEQEVRRWAKKEEECANAVVSVVLECKDGVCHKNADSINEHAGNPESNVLSIWLVGALLSEDPEAAVEDEGSVDESIGKPLDEEPGGEAGSINTYPVKHWVSHEVALQLSLGKIHLHINILPVLEVKDAVEKNWQGSHGDVVHLIDQLFVKGLSGEGCEESEIELWYHIEEVLVEVVKHKQWITSVSFATVEEQKRLQEFKLTDSKISTSSSLLSFFTENTNTYMSL